MISKQAGKSPSKLELQHERWNPSQSSSFSGCADKSRFIWKISQRLREGSSKSPEQGPSTGTSDRDDLECGVDVG